VRSPYDTLLRASVALRAVPGEFDQHWMGRVTQAASALAPQKSVMEPADVQARLVALGDVLTAAETNVAAVAGRSKLLAMKKAMELAQFLISRLRAGWNESGMWNPSARWPRRRGRGRGARGRALLPPARRAARHAAGRRQAAAGRGGGAGRGVRLARDGFETNPSPSNEGTRASEVPFFRTVSERKVRAVRNCCCRVRSTRGAGVSGAVNGRARPRVDQPDPRTTNMTELPARSPAIRPASLAALACALVGALALAMDPAQAIVDASAVTLLGPDGTPLRPSAPARAATPEAMAGAASDALLASSMLRARTSTGAMPERGNVATARAAPHRGGRPRSQLPRAARARRARRGAAAGGRAAARRHAVGRGHLARDEPAHAGRARGLPGRRARGAGPPLERRARRHRRRRPSTTCASSRP
jgi:hypothetical protein